MKMLLILTLWIGASFAQNTPPAPQFGEGLQITPAETLADFRQSDAAALDVWLPAFLPDDEIAYGRPVYPIFASEMKTLGRKIDRLFDRIQRAGAGLWWMFGHYDADAWYFNVQENSDALTHETLGERLASGEFAAEFSPLYRLYAPDLCVSDGESDTQPFNLAPVPVSFENGEGWASISGCLSFSYLIGDGPECSGIGSTYMATFWYNVAGLSSDGAHLVTASIPIRVNGTPLRSAGITRCTNPDDPNQMTMRQEPAPLEWEAQGWADYTASSFYPVLKAEAQAGLAEEIRGWLETEIALPPDESALAGVFAALNDTMATLTLDDAWIAQKLDAP